MFTQKEVDHFRNNQIANQKILIGNNWVSSKSGKSQSIVSPIDGKIISNLQVSDIEDVNDAVRSCREVFDKGDWSNMPPINRKKIMIKIAELIEKAVDMTG